MSELQGLDNYAFKCKFDQNWVKTKKDNDLLRVQHCCQRTCHSEYLMRFLVDHSGSVGCVSDW